jgi:C-terminal processing protease CtpA/Prc
VVLGDVTPEGPAEKAGLETGDIVVSVNGKPMENARQLEVNLYRYTRGEKVKVEVLRGTGGSHGVDVTGGMRAKVELIWRLVTAALERLGWCRTPKDWQGKRHWVKS